MSVFKKIIASFRQAFGAPPSAANDNQTIHGVTEFNSLTEEQHPYQY